MIDLFAIFRRGKWAQVMLRAGQLAEMAANVFPSLLGRRGVFPLAPAAVVRAAIRDLSSLVLGDDALALVVGIEEAVAEVIRAPQQNLWVCFGSGSLPRLCRRANFATFAVRNPYDFLVTNFTLLFRPSTAPDETSPLARNQFRIKGR